MIFTKAKLLLVSAAYLFVQSLTVVAAADNEFCYRMSWDPDVNGAFQQTGLVRPVTAFAPEHSLIVSKNCVKVGDPIPHLGFRSGYNPLHTGLNTCPTSNSAAQAFYSLNNPIGASSVSLT